MKLIPLPKSLRFARYQNSHGKVIPMHHAFKTIKLSRVSRMNAIGLPGVFLVITWLFLPSILDFWGEIFAFWMQHIYSGSVGYEPQTILGRDILLPYPMLEALPPTDYAVWMNLIGCFVVFLISLLMPKGMVPLTYLARTLLIIQASASVDRLLSPKFFPYTLKIYMLDSLDLCVYMLMVLPLLLGMVYYIFDFSLGRKCLLTIMMFGYYMLFIPCQYMLHAYFIHEYSLLMLPLAYVFFGVLMDVLAFISIYSLGMSWASHIEAEQGRGV